MPRPREADGRFSIVHGGRSRTIDRRHPAAAKASRRRAALARDQGASWAALSAARKMLTARAAFKSVVLDRLEAFVLKHDVLTDGGEVKPPLEERYLSIAASLRADLVALGLERRAPAELTLDEILRRRRTPEFTGTAS